MPRLEDYVRRYPQYVDEIADFVTYFYAVEVGLPTNTASMPSLSAGSRAALELAWDRVATPLPADPLTLMELARRRRYSLKHLATGLDLSVDIIEQLDRHQIEPASLPQELVQRLGHTLAQSFNLVRQALGLPAQSSLPLLAEERATYASGLPSFRAALASSDQLSVTQRESWQAVLEHEGL